MAPPILGIDIGGSGIKANLVDVDTGALVSSRFKLPTPQPSVPKAVAEVVEQVVTHFDYRGPVGCTFPAIIKRGVALSAANVDTAWIGTDVDALLEERTGLPVSVMNDADAAGVAEMRFGAGRGHAGTVLVLTFGTGIGSGMFVDGRLVPNTELGHLEFEGHSPAEAWAAARVKDDMGLTWEEWAGRVDSFLHHLHRVLSPDLFVVGGGVSRRFDKFSGYLTVEVETLPAALENQAGIVGAAIHTLGLDRLTEP